MVPDFDRIIRAANHQENDRLPIGELLIDYTIQSEFLGREVTPDNLAAQVEFWRQAGYDYIPIPVSMMTPGEVTGESRITRVLKKFVQERNPSIEDEKAWNLEYSSFIKDRADFESFPWQEAGVIDLARIESVAGFLPDGMKVIAVSGKIFTLSWMLMGFSDFCTKLMLEEDLVSGVITRVAEIQLSVLDRLLALDHVAGVWAVDDLAFGTGPMISPAAYRAHIFPWYKKVAEKAHKRGRLFLFHSDGKLDKIIPDLLEMGVDILHPIDPSCMDIFALHQEYQGQLCLMGNVSNELLQSGSPEQIAEYCHRLIREVAPRRGYILGSGNSVPHWAAFENFQAMRKTALEERNHSIDT